MIFVCVVLVGGLSAAEEPRPGGISDFLPGKNVRLGTLRTLQTVDREAAKRELAEGLYQSDWLEARAESAAAGALATWKNGGDDQLTAKLEAAAEKVGESALTPKLEETPEFGRADTPVPGLSTAVLIDAVFSLEGGAEFPERPVKVGREWVVFKLVNRTRPDEAAFNETMQSTTRDVLETLKKKETVDLYIQRLRAQAQADNALRVNALPTQNGQS